MIKFTKEFYDNLQIAYDFFNEQLFNGELPQCLVTLNRKNGAYGYFKRNAFTNSACENIHEIALNPSEFNRPIKEILSTLVHEQCHLLCYHKGYVMKRGGHGKQWCQMMKDIGLQPIDATTGLDIESGGAKVSHRIIEGDLFDMVCDKLLEKIKFDLTNVPEVKEKPARKSNKVTYICPECECEISAKKDQEINIICGNCSVQFVKVEE